MFHSNTKFCLAPKPRLSLLPELLALLGLILLLRLIPLPIPRINITKTQKTVYNSDDLRLFEKSITGVEETFKTFLNGGS
jgi:hypothetical protein